MYSDILRYMGHKGDADTQIINMISACVNKLAAISDPRYVIKMLPCTVTDSSVTLDTLTVNSRVLASHLSNCGQAYVFAATLGACVDRLIAQRAIVNTLEALCLQACATSQIENYCDNIEQELAHNANSQGLSITSRFSPGYEDFDIAYQSDILRLLNAQKHAGVTETKSHMLSPLKSVTAVIGVNSCNSYTPLRVVHDKKFIKLAVIRPPTCNSWTKKCDNCNKPDCEFRAVKGISYD